MSPTCLVAHSQHPLVLLPDLSINLMTPGPEQRTKTKETQNQSMLAGIGRWVVDVVTTKKRSYKDAAHSTTEVHGAWPWFKLILSTLICDNHVIDNAAVFMTCWTRSARMTWRLCVYIACSLEIPINRNKAIMKWKRGITQQTRYAFTCANVENKKVQGVFFTGPALKALSMELGPPKNREWLVLPNRLKTADWLIESM